MALLKEKSNVLEQFERFKYMVEAKRELKLKFLRSDQGGEFISEEFKTFCDKSGIKRQFTSPYTP